MNSPARPQGFGRRPGRGGRGEAPVVPVGRGAACAREGKRLNGQNIGDGGVGTQAKRRIITYCAVRHIHGRERRLSLDRFTSALLPYCPPAAEPSRVIR